MAKEPAVSSTQIYEVLVGYEQPHKGVGVNAYFPETATIHAGDTVRWVQNSNEIHTVTFLAGTEPAPLIVPAASLGFPSNPSPLIFNPLAVNPAGPENGVYDGVGYVNSGLMGREPGQVEEFDLTFSVEGIFDYMCLVHGVMMSGRIVVVAPDIAIPSPKQAIAEGRREIAESLSVVSAVMRDAKAQIQPPATNPDGTMTHHVWIGYAEGQIDLMQFFPDRLTVRPGDTVIWEMSPESDAPHTVTFLNGEAEPGLVIPVPQPSGPPLLYANPEVFFPQLPSEELVREGIYNSGVMEPIPGATFELVLGDMKPGPEPFVCLLHDSSGMEGVLTVVPR
ncbi:MAG: hypothetical protein ACM3VT_02350 [Solirubrobacterales bacterium]